MVASFRSALSAVVLGAVACNTLVAQGKPRGVVAVTVLDAGSGAGVAEVTLQLMGMPDPLRTDSSGVARFVDVPSGSHILAARRLGYTRATAVVAVGGADTTSVMLFMRGMNARLPEVTVKEKATPVNLREFEQRRKYGTGKYITQDQIDAAVGANLNTLVARLSLGADQVVWNHRGGNARCQLTAYLNGLHLRADDVTEIIPLNLAGVEYYTGPFIPVQYRRNAGCGVVLFWTK